MIGQGNLAYQGIEKESQLFELQTNLKNREKLFEIYKRCMQKSRIDFFEINPDNLINCSRHVWQPPFFRNILINDLGNSFALMYNQLFSNMVSVELYSTLVDVVPSILDDILRILSKRGIPFAQIWLFYPNIDFSHNWFENKGFRTFQFVEMGKILNPKTKEEIDHKSLF